MKYRDIGIIHPGKEEEIARFTHLYSILLYMLHRKSLFADSSSRPASKVGECENDSWYVGGMDSRAAV